MTRPVVVVMARSPRLGCAKTRLAREIGPVEAWRINRAMHARVMRTLIDCRWRLVLAVTPDADVSLRLPGVWPPRRAVRRAGQGRGDLGARLARAVRLHRRIAVIGTDCPAMRRSDIAAAFSALSRARVAIGPALDGGFWVLAARRGRDVAPAFACVRWSTADTLADLEAALAAKVWRLRPLRDVDTLADWRAAQREPWPVSDGSRSMAW